MHWQGIEFRRLMFLLRSSFSRKWSFLKLITSNQFTPLSISIFSRKQLTPLTLAHLHNTVNYCSEHGVRCAFKNLQLTNAGLSTPLCFGFKMKTCLACANASFLEDGHSRSIKFHFWWKPHQGHLHHLSKVSGKACWPPVGGAGICFLNMGDFFFISPQAS